MLLWKAVCANKLLARVDLVLFLNKCDILSAKLAAGVRLAKYVRSFGERPNDAETAEKCECLRDFAGLCSRGGGGACSRMGDLCLKWQGACRPRSVIPRQASAAGAPVTSDPMRFCIGARAGPSATR